MREDIAGYLLVHFTGESTVGEQIYFSLSEDGLHWRDLNRGFPILESAIGEKGVRDPFLLRMVGENKYILIATDLRIANGKGWEVAQFEGSRDIIVWESTDLIHWSDARRVEVGIPEAGCVWAPEVIYDKAREDYLVFFASMVKEEKDAEAKQRIYRVKTKDFKSFTKAEKYIERKEHVIDTTIIEENGIYYRISKDETSKNIIIDSGADLLGATFTQLDCPALSAVMGVEGPIAFPMKKENQWCLLVDQFAAGKGYLPLVTDCLAEGHFRILEDSEYDMGVNQKRHGSVLTLNQTEFDTVKENYLHTNPILPGLYADPDITKFDDRYYIYPTTDGFEGWSGTQFKVFSSPDLKTWEDHGVILDLATDDVPWATGYAWAPAITEKNGKYYYYFCGKMQDGVSGIGVAVAEHPTGPFQAMPKPLLTPELLRQHDLVIGQVIDPSVYKEEDGTYYLLFGNGTPVIVELGEELTSIKEKTMKPIEGAFDFREAITVLKRDNRYHFTWSCDDTGSENYHINYGISDSLYGPIAYQYPILEKDSDKNILGTGHHSIMKKDEDSYILAYHRLFEPSKDSTDYKGYRRETCMERMVMTKEGLIQKVVVNN
jgi:beta-xylosidase